jgi:hypothetical protein
MALRSEQMPFIDRPRREPTFAGESRMSQTILKQSLAVAPPRADPGRKPPTVVAAVDTMEVLRPSLALGALRFECFCRNGPVDEASPPHTHR